MEYKANEIKVGIMLLVALTALVIFLVAIFGVDFGEEYNHFHTRLKYVGGIEAGSLIKYNGMDVGEVTEITLPDFSSPDNTIALKFQVQKGTPVRIDSKAFVSSIGIMRDQHIEITPGSPGAPPLPSGSEIESKEVISFMQMAEPLGEMSERAQALIDRLADIFNDQNRMHFSSMMANMDTMVENSSEQLVQLVSNLDKLSGNLVSISEELNALIDNNSENIEQTLANLESTSSESSELLKQMRNNLNQVESMMSANGESLMEMIDNFQYASQNLEEFTRILKERPWLLVRKAAPPERKVP
jgi:phospholipid/cholesterol/gamma-HCH transport system substrate-binding protein